MHDCSRWYVGTLVAFFTLYGELFKTYVCKYANNMNNMYNMKI